MNPLGTALLAAVITAGGVFAYDALRGSPPAAVEPSPSEDAPLLPDTAPVLATKGVPVADLGAALERRLAAQDRRIAAMEENIDSIKAGLESFREVWMKAGPRPVPGTDEANPLPARTGSDLDQDALRLVERQMEEIARRRRMQLREANVRKHLGRLDLGLTSGTQDDLLKTILAFQAESDAFWKRARDQALDPQSQRPAYAQLIAQYRKRVEALVPNEAAAGEVARRFMGAGADPVAGRPMPVPVPRSSGGR